MIALLAMHLTLQHPFAASCPIPKAAYSVADTGNPPRGWRDRKGWKQADKWEACVCGPAGHTDENLIERNDAGVPVPTCAKWDWNGHRYLQEK